MSHDEVVASLWGNMECFPRSSGPRSNALDGVHRLYLDCSLLVPIEFPGSFLVVSSLDTTLRIYVS